MANVLHIRTTDLAKATGFFKQKDGVENTEYAVYLPSVDCSLPMTYTQSMMILEVVATSGIEWDYVTVHDGDYSGSSYGFLENFSDEIKFSPKARLNIPAWVGAYI